MAKAKANLRKSQTRQRHSVHTQPGAGTTRIPEPQLFVRPDAALRSTQPRHRLLWEREGGTKAPPPHAATTTTTTTTGPVATSASTQLARDDAVFDFRAVFQSPSGHSNNGMGDDGWWSDEDGGSRNVRPEHREGGMSWLLALLYDSDSILAALAAQLFAALVAASPTALGVLLASTVAVPADDSPRSGAAALELGREAGLVQDAVVEVSGLDVLFSQLYHRDVCPAVQLGCLEVVAALASRVYLPLPRVVWSSLRDTRSVEEEVGLGGGGGRYDEDRESYNDVNDSGDQEGGADDERMRKGRGSMREEQGGLHATARVKTCVVLDAFRFFDAVQTLSSDASGPETLSVLCTAVHRLVMHHARQLLSVTSTCASIEALVRACLHRLRDHERVRAATASPALCLWRLLELDVLKLACTLAGPQHRSHTPLWLRQAVVRHLGGHWCLQGTLPSCMNDVLRFLTVALPTTPTQMQDVQHGVVRLPVGHAALAELGTDADQALVRAAPAIAAATTTTGKSKSSRSRSSSRKAGGDRARHRSHHQWSARDSTSQKARAQQHSEGAARNTGQRAVHVVASVRVRQGLELAASMCESLLLCVCDPGSGTAPTAAHLSGGVGTSAVDGEQGSADPVGQLLEVLASQIPALLQLCRLLSRAVACVHTTGLSGVHVQRLRDDCTVAFERCTTMLHGVLLRFEPLHWLALVDIRTQADTAHAAHATADLHGTGPQMPGGRATYSGGRDESSVGHVDAMVQDVLSCLHSARHVWQESLDDELMQCAWSQLLGVLACFCVYVEGLSEGRTLEAVRQLCVSTLRRLQQCSLKAVGEHDHSLIGVVRAAMEDVLHVIACSHLHEPGPESSVESIVPVIAALGHVRTTCAATLPLRCSWLKAVIGAVATVESMDPEALQETEQVVRPVMKRLSAAAVKSEEEAGLILCLCKHLSTCSKFRPAFQSERVLDSIRDKWLKAALALGPGWRQGQTLWEAGGGPQELGSPALLAATSPPGLQLHLCSFLAAFSLHQEGRVRISRLAITDGLVSLTSDKRHSTVALLALYTLRNMCYYSSSTLPTASLVRCFARKLQSVGVKKRVAHGKLAREGDGGSQRLEHHHSQQHQRWHRHRQQQRQEKHDALMFAERGLKLGAGRRTGKHGEQEGRDVEVQVFVLQQEEQLCQDGLSALGQLHPKAFASAVGGLDVRLASAVERALS